MKIKKYISQFIGKIKAFFIEEKAGSFIEYALLLGFALFLFLLIFGAATSIMDWTLGLKDEFLGLFG